jgi:beta-glucosidase-like glycosyl hydrolase
LKTKLGYAGLAVADLRPSAVTVGSPDLGDAAAQAMIAGCDILVTMVGGAGRVLGGLRRALELGRLTTERMDQSLERVRAARRRVARPGGRVRKAEVDRLAKRFERFSEECQAEEPKIG